MPAEYNFALPSLFASEANFAPIEKLNGTNIDTLVCAFDDTTEEYRNGSFTVPGDIDTSGTVTFRAYVRNKTAATSNNVALTFGHLALNDAETADAAYTDEDSGDQAITDANTTVDEITWTETVTNLGWAANNMINFRISRDPADTSNLAGDMYWYTFTIEIPVA